MTQSEFVIVCGACSFEELVLVGELLSEFQAKSPDALVDPLRVMVPLGGGAGFGRDDDGEVFGGEVFAEEDDLLGGEFSADGFRERLELRVGTETGGVEEVESGLADDAADLVSKGASLGAARVRPRGGW